MKIQLKTLHRKKFGKLTDKIAQRQGCLDRAQDMLAQNILDLKVREVEKEVVQ